MPWSQFTKGAFPGSSRAVFGPFLAVPHGNRCDLDRVPSILFTPRGTRVTFNSNLKVTRAPAKNKPRIKPVNCPAEARRGPCRDPSGKRWHILKESTQGIRLTPLRYPGGWLWGSWLVLQGTRAESRRCPYDARTGPGQSPWIISRGIIVNWSMFNKSIHK